MLFYVSNQICKVKGNKYKTAAPSVETHIGRWNLFSSYFLLSCSNIVAKIPIKLITEVICVCVYAYRT